MQNERPVLSICTTCRDSREKENVRRAGNRLAQRVQQERGGIADTQLTLRGVECLSQCKRSCVVSLSAHGRFTYVFGELDPENPEHVAALFELVAQYKRAPEGFLARHERPEALRSNILGRLPPMNSASQLVTHLDTARAA